MGKCKGCLDFQLLMTQALLLETPRKCNVMLLNISQF
jgi:hypothetical protein